ncbi:MAG TPA: GNAT family N-acetyltransferase [Candidatus Sulfotelmatobacter sp.]|nr:GNAT family N-acetyltransferase [Candidatus Sulfotelmatobacter sp.]
MIAYAAETDLSALEFQDVLRRSTLGERRPVDDLERLEAMLRNAPLTVTARDGAGKLVGVSRSVTDFVYCCYLSDLCVDAALQRQGVGKRLIEETRARLKPGCSLILLAAPAAMDYYPRVGFDKMERCWWVPGKR